MAERAAIPGSRASGETRVAAVLVGPAVGVVLAVAVFPIGWTVWESLHRHDLRMPWLGTPFVGLANYAEAAGSPRFWAALAHTFFFTATSVALELGLGLALALALHRSFRGRGLVRTTSLLPWALPTVVAALVWRFLFEGPHSLVNAALVGSGLLATPHVWLADPIGAWVPLVAADVWKTTPFVALLLLTGLAGVDESVLDAARVDGAGRLRELWYVTLPLLRPAILVALVFRSLDAFRVFDLVYVLTGGGPGTATEPLSLYAFDALLGRLRFGYGSALSLIVFGVSFALAVGFVRLVGAGLLEEGRG